MKILICQHRFHPNSVGIVEGLIDAGHEVSMIVNVTDPGEDWSRLEPIVVPYRPSSLRKHHGNEIIRNGMPNVWSSLRHVWRIRPDVTILKQVTPTTRIVGLTSRFLGSRNVLLSNSPKVKRANAYLDKALEALGAIPKRRIHTTVPPKATVEPWQSAVASGSVVMPYPVVGRGPVRLGSVASNPNGHTRILSIGKLGSARKRLDWVLRAVALARLADRVEITIVGTSALSLSQVPRLYAVAEELGIGALEVLVDLPYQQLQSEYAKHDIFVLAASDEPFGAVVPEAMAHGLPVVCSDTCGARICFDDKMSGFVFRENDLAHLANILGRLASDSRLRTEVGRRAHEVVLDRWSPASWVAGFQALIDLPLGSRPDRAAL